jgi:hypothetical protein
VVTFDGVSAKIKSVTAAKIITIVPSGAATGYVKVTTPGGTAESPKTFTVR